MMRRIFTVVVLMLFAASMALADVQTPEPEIVVYEGEEVWVVEAYAYGGEGEVYLYMGGEEVENPYEIDRTTEDQYYHFEAYAQAEGCLPSEWVELDVMVPAVEDPIIPIMPVFGMNYTLTDEYLFFEPYVSDDSFSVGEVLVDGVLFNPPYMLPRCNYDYEVDFFVTFVAEGLENLFEEFYYVVPALEGDPHDVDFNGRVNIDDVVALIDYLLGHGSEGINLGKADCDADGYININDVTELINYLLQKKVS